MAISSCKQLVTCLTIFLLFFCAWTKAQTKAEISKAKKQYEGSWYNSVTKRHITISFDTETSYATINDWTGKYNSSSVDVYKAFIKGNKLILYAENSDHHSPYCEMEVVDQKLVYQCNTGLNFKDQFLKKKIDKTLYKHLAE